MYRTLTDGMPAWMQILMPKLVAFIVTLLVGLFTAWKIDLNPVEQEALTTAIGVGLATLYGILKSYFTAKSNPYNVSSPSKLKEIKEEEKINGNQPN